ncbi:MAG: metalloregulator ArsR/SmtB family transcription factor [Pseudomonadota bacterium]
MTYAIEFEDKVWRALGDRKRRRILEALVKTPMLTGELVDLLPSIGRTGVLRHIGILTDANLIVVRPEGRKRWNHFNPDPVRRVCNEWVALHIEGVEASTAKLKSIAESEVHSKTEDNI